MKENLCRNKSKVGAYYVAQRLLSSNAYVVIIMPRRHYKNMLISKLKKHKIINERR